MSDSKEVVWVVELLSDERKVVETERVRASSWGRARETVTALPKWPSDPLDMRIRCTPERR